VSARIVLDTSAILAYGRAGVHVGELIMMVSEEAGAVGVPVACLVEAYAEAKPLETTTIDYLATGLAAVSVLPLDPADARRIGEMSRHASVGMAHAITAATRERSFIVTADGATVRSLVDDDSLIIDLPREPGAPG
jgi:hypothetical protein